MAQKPLSGRARRARPTRFGVRFSERASRLLITVGGIGTIAAVTLIFVFLVLVVLPLFTGAKVSEVREVAAARAPGEGEPVHFAIDEYGALAAFLARDGTIRVVDLEDGTLLEEQNPFAEAELPPPSAWSIAPLGRSVAFGFDDGTIRLSSFGFAATFPREKTLPEHLLELGQDEQAVHAGGILQRTPEGKFRLQRFAFELGPPIGPAVRAPVLRLTHIADGDDAVFCAWFEGGGLVRIQTEEEPNLLTGEIEYDLRETRLPYEADSNRGTPAHAMLAGIGDTLLLIWEDGRLERVDMRRPAESVVAEAVDLVPEEGATLTAAAFLIGSSTLITGASDGRIRAWFGTKPDDADTIDGTVFAMGHELYAATVGVTALAPSPRSRLLGAGFEDGSVRLLHVTTNQVVSTVQSAEESGTQAVLVLPKENGIAALGPQGISLWKIDPRHPEATLAALFGPVWYEGYPEPEHVWQSESATDDFEPKFGFMPLVYGTLKATFYSMIFGTPLALLAAIFTSEFLDRRLRVPIKSTIEMMASLPSVVLGFLAGIVIAPFAQKIIPATLAVFATLPFALLAGAYAWQLLPQQKAIRWRGWPRLVCIAVALPIGIVAALVCGPWIESVFFAGDMELWLDGQVGNAVGGWVLILLPASAVAVVLLGGPVFQAWVRARSADWGRRKCAAVDVVKFAGGTVLTLVVALALSWGLQLAGFDPRGSVFDTYVQRNALVVGFVMGFAVIPIIYTLAEDALTSVPEHLRQASLGAGATPWQTAMRVIVPTAMSGLFSAVMIGLGRAVGETMIVLMATGNTPVMEMNVFNGFRTLSANIAVELPEAVQNSTHYRTLFLAALVLFAMTFVVNTFAEIVRLRFRKRAYQL